MSIELTQDIKDAMKVIMYGICFGMGNDYRLELLSKHNILKLNDKYYQRTISIS